MATTPMTMSSYEHELHVMNMNYSSGFADIHSHFLYGMDDGAKSREVMEQMLDMAFAQGITSLFATSHVTPGINPFDEYTYFTHLEESNRYCQQMDYGIQIYQGSEVLYTPALDDYVTNHRLITLANSDCVLMEFISQITSTEAEHAVNILTEAGYIPIIAHIERYECFKGNFPERLKSQHDLKYQVNANTIINAFQKSKSEILNPAALIRKKRIADWLKSDLLDFTASDAHSCHARPFRMKEVYDVLYQHFGYAMADRLCGRE